ncbi:MAG: hypothetical protein ACRDZP_00905 [Acidimicrobiales bacterium]
MRSRSARKCVIVVVALAALGTSGCLRSPSSAAPLRGPSPAAVCATRVEHAVVTAVTPDGALSRAWSDYAATGEGWVAGDSMYAYRVPHLGTLDTFSDSYLYSLTKLKRRRIVHNLFVLRGSRGWQTITRGSATSPSALLQAPRGWFYLGLGGIDQGRTFQEFFMEAHWWGPGSLDWSLARIVLATFSLPGLRLEQVLQISGGHPAIRWGSSVERFGAWTYVYGASVGPSGLGAGYVARVPGTDLRARWSYFDGRGWSAYSTAARPLVAAVQPQYDVTRYEGMYVLVTSDPSPEFSPYAHVYFGCAPTGPFHRRQQILLSDYVGSLGAGHWGGRWGDGSVYVYDALAQPALERNGNFVVSYDRNAVLFPAVFGSTGIYRPGYLDLTIWTGSA